MEVVAVARGAPPDLAARWTGATQAEDYALRNGVTGEWPVRVGPATIVAHQSVTC